MQRKRNVYAVVAVALIGALGGTAFAAPIVVDFSTDQGGNLLANGQKIDTEFTSPLAIWSPNTGVSHLGPTIFDSTIGGPNMGGGDPDLLVDLGNVLILQNTAYPADFGGSDIFETPDDEADYNPLGIGTIVFDFAYAVELMSIDLIDIDGTVAVDLVLLDGSGSARNYFVPSNWTHDIHSQGPDGYDTLDLTTLAPQPGEGGSVATGFDVGAFDPADVRQLAVTYNGSAALDNLVYVPEPATLGLVLVGACCVWRKRKAC